MGFRKGGSDVKRKPLHQNKSDLKRPRILIYCYDYPPFKSVGAIRPYAWAKQLSKLGFKVSVLTRKWELDSHLAKRVIKSDPDGVEVLQQGKITTLRIPFRSRIKDRLTEIPFAGKYIRKSMTLLELFLKWHLPIFDEKDFLRRYLMKELAQAKYDLVIVSGEPYILFHHVHEAFKVYKVPFVLDYRDGWSFNEIVAQENQNIFHRMIKRIELNAERQAISDCLFYLSVHHSIIDKYTQKFPGVPGYVIENGIDLATFQQAKKMPNPYQDDRFVIVYTGIFYPKHKVSLFLNAIENVLSTSPDFKQDVKCVFVGIDKHPNSNSALVYDFKIKYPDNISIIEPVTHVQALTYQWYAQVLLKFSAMAQNVAGFGSKIYEYVATGNPILTIQSSGIKRSTFFHEKQVQHICLEQTEVEMYLTEQYSKWNSEKSLKTAINDEDIRKISRAFQVQLLAAHIEASLA